MRNPVKTAKRQLLRVGSCALSALLALGSIPAAAIGDGVTATYDEAYYAMTDYYGNLTDGSVVKSYRTNGIATLTDYGDYDEVINLTDGTAPMQNGGKTVFQLDEKSLPGTFYFEGKTTKPFEQLPWTLSVSYTLNGVPTKAEDLAGQTGIVEIRLDAVPNEGASEYAQNNYTLEAMAIFNQDDILSLEAPGAQVQLIGNLRAVLFLGLPGEECHYTIRVGSEDFSFGGMTFLMVPATLSQLEEIAKLSERKDDLEDNYNKLSGSMDSLLDAMAAMTGSLNASANGLDQLNKARGIFSNGKDVIYSGTDALRGDLSNLADVLEPVEGQIRALSKTITDSKSTLRSMTDTVSDLKDDLKDVEDALEDLEDGKGDLEAVLKASKQLSGALTKLQKDLGQTTIPSVDVEGNEGDALRKQMEIIKLLHSAYSENDLTAFLTDMLLANMLLGSDLITPNAAAKKQAKAQAQQIAGVVAACGGDLSKAIAALKAQGQADAANLLTLYGAKMQGMFPDFQKFCYQVLMASGKYSDAEAKTLSKKMNDLWLVYAAGDGGTSTASAESFAELEDLDELFTIETAFLQNDEEPGNETNDDSQDVQPDEEKGNQADGAGSEETEENTDPNTKPNDAVVDLITDGINDASQQIKNLQIQLSQTMTGLKNATAPVLSRLTELCGALGDLTGMLDDAEDLSAAIRNSSADLRDILTDVEDLQDILDDYEPILQDTLKTVSSFSTGAIKTIRDTQTLISDTEALMKSTGATLDDGTKQTLEGLAAVLRSTAKTMGTAGQIKDAKTSICDIIEDTWDEYTGDVNNLLLMDATAEAVSLTDSRNPSPESIQILIRTQEITMPDEDETEAEAAAEVQTTFWGRVAQMFKDFWAAITGLFGGKD